MCQATVPTQPGPGPACYYSSNSVWIFPRGEKKVLEMNTISVQRIILSSLFCQIIQRKERIWTLLQEHCHSVISNTCVHSTGQDDRTGNQLVEKGKRKHCCWSEHRTWPWEHISFLSLYFGSGSLVYKLWKCQRKIKPPVKNVNFKLWNDNKQSGSYQCKAAHSCICSRPRRRCTSPGSSTGLTHTR